MKKINTNIFLKNRPISDLPNRLNDTVYFDPEKSGNEALKGNIKNNFNVGLLLGILFCLILIYKLFFLQIEEGLANFRIAEGNRTRSIMSPAPRGLIVDEGGEPIVKNESSYQLVCHINKKADLERVDQKVFDLIELDKDGVWERIRKSDLTGNVVLKEKIQRENALLLKKNLLSYDGFEVVPMYIRVYPYRNLSHSLGYIGKVSKEELESRPSISVNQIIGKSGIEKAYDQYLQGIPGIKKIEVDAAGRMIRHLSETDPQIGHTIVSSIDLGLQQYIAERLGRAVGEMRTRGAVVALDPRDGAIKSLVSFPDFDNTKVSGGMSNEEYSSLTNDKSNPLLNRVISGEYPSGSSIKPFIATVALANGIISRETAFETPAKIDIGQWSFPDWKWHLGKSNVVRAIAESNNIFFYAIGGGWGPVKNGLGPMKMKEGLEKFGFGVKIGIDILGERAGFIPTPEWKKKITGENWYVGNTYNMSIGQGDLLVTPMQVANATAMIANGGVLYKPHFIRKILDGSGDVVKEFSSEDYIYSKNIFSKENIDPVREGMRLTITGGSAYSSFGDNFPVEVAGKTGTAQFGSEEKTHAWFTSFAPYNNPELVVTVLIEGGGEGSRVSAPIASDIFRWWSENRVK